MIALLVAFAILIPASGGRAGGLVDDDLKTAARFEAQAEYQRAAEAFARVLRLEPGNRKAKSGLSRVAGPAIADRLASARSFEESRRFTDAQIELSTAVQLLDRIESAGLALGDEFDVNAAYEGLIDRWVENFHGEALAAQEDEMWSAAVAHLRKIEALRPGYRDTRARLVEVWTAWGNQELDQRMYRSAADRFVEASRVPGKTDDAAANQAAAIMAALGAHALEKGAYRASIRDYRLAMMVAPDAVRPGVLEKAESCARTCLSLAAGFDPETGLEASRVEQLGAEIRKLVADRGSRFLLVIQRGSGDRSPCDPRPPAGSPEVAAADQPRRIRATVELTSQTMLRSPATSRNSEFRSRQTIGDEIVGESVVVIRIYEEVFSGVMTGTITLTDQKSGRISPPIPFRVQAEATAQWVKDTGSLLATGTSVRSTGNASRPGVPGLDRLIRIDDQRQQARSRLGESLFQEFAAEATRLILESVDAEPEMSDPASIDLGFLSAADE